MNKKLSPCPQTPNCVCSEMTDRSWSIPPVSFTGTPERAWRRATAIVLKMSGKILEEEDGYLHATFTSRILRFVDDLELRLDAQHNLIHLRSASRSGYWDFGVNRRRAEQFRSMFVAQDGLTT